MKYKDRDFVISGGDKLFVGPCAEETVFLLFEKLIWGSVLLVSFFFTLLTSAP